jgi:hypothetical protein
MCDLGEEVGGVKSHMTLMKVIFDVAGQGQKITEYPIVLQQAARNCMMPS